MKKLAIICVLILFAYSPLQAQLKILNQNQIKIHKPSSESEKYFVLEVKEKGFLLCEIFDSKNKSGYYTWNFTFLDKQVKTQWTKEVDLDQNLVVLGMDVYDGDLNIVLFENKAVIGLKYIAKSFVLLKISHEGVMSQNEVKLSEKIEIEKGEFVNDACYFDARMKKYDAIMKIDFSSNSISHNILKKPDNSFVVNSGRFDNVIYYRVRSLSDDNSDMIYKIEDGVVVDKLKMQRTDKNDIELVNIAKSDSSHLFVVISTMNARYGGVSIAKKLEKQLCVSNMNDLEKQSYKLIDKVSSDALCKDRSIVVKNSALANAFTGINTLCESGYFISNCIRVNDKNIIVFEKHQSIRFETDKLSRFVSYIFTNTIVWCISDDGTLEWSKNFESENLSPFLDSKISAIKYDDQSFALVGFFNSELAYKIISMNGEIVKDAVNNKSASNTKVDKSQFVGNSIKYLDNGTFLVWGTDEDNTKGKTVNVNFKIVELK